MQVTTLQNIFKEFFIRPPSNTYSLWLFVNNTYKSPKKHSLLSYILWFLSITHSNNIFLKFLLLLLSSLLFSFWINISSTYIWSKFDLDIWWAIRADVFFTLLFWFFWVNNSPVVTEFRFSNIFLFVSFVGLWKNGIAVGVLAPKMRVRLDRCF